jgi:hypothetical protein
MTPAEKIRSLKELKSSPGWAILKDALTLDYSLRVTTLARNRKMDRDDIEFTRGVIFAIEFLSSAPDSLIGRIESSEKLEKSKKSDTSGES